jgi:16S rRNA (cytidine1402-2'-O)-methyltransferase
MSTLFLVATPIGNLEDFSPRGQRILAEVDLIAAEDTRHSRKLLSHFEIHTPLTSFFEHNQLTKLDEILTALEKADVALVADAGTPGINDPGYALVRAALDAGHDVSPIPGPSAPIAALAASGLPTDQFLYLGYPPRKSGERQRVFEKLAPLPYTLVWLESPHRLCNTLEDLHAVFGDRAVAIAGEMTKRFERFFRGDLSEAITFYTTEPARGEFTIVLAGASPQVSEWAEDEVRVALSAGLNGSQSPSQLARQIASESGWSRSKVYDLLQKLLASK